MSPGTAGELASRAERLADTGYAAGWWLARVLPAGTVLAAGRVAADVAWLRRGAGVRRLEGNLARVLPEADPRRLSRWALRSYLRYWVEVFRLPVTRPAEVLAGMQVAGEDRLRAAVAAGRGVVLALPHMGNWDQAGAWLVATGVPFTTVAERLRPYSLYERFVAFRTGLGMEVLAHDGGGAGYRTLLTRLRAGGVVCLLADRELGPGGVTVSFFGAPARMPGGPAALALATGAALLPVTLWYPPDGGPGWRARIHPPVEPPAGGGRAAAVAAMTQAVADAFATGIREHPADWHMLQRLWVDDAPADARRSDVPAAGLVRG